MKRPDHHSTPELHRSLDLAWQADGMRDGLAGRPHRFAWFKLHQPVTPMPKLPGVPGHYTIGWINGWLIREPGCA